MNFNLTDEQRLLQDSVRRFVDKDYDFEARTARIRSAEPCNARHWAIFAENGWLAAALPESQGLLRGIRDLETGPAWRRILDLKLAELGGGSSGTAGRGMGRMSCPSSGGMPCRAP